MRRNLTALALAAYAVMGIGSVASADDYEIDPTHSGVTFHAWHEGVSYIPGRFKSYSGEVALNPADLGITSVQMSIDSESVDTNNPKRDGHLKSPDFFNAKQFPKIEFASTSVVRTPAGHQVTGNLTCHGETKAITFLLKGGRQMITTSKGVQKAGYIAQFYIKCSDFGVGENVHDKTFGDSVLVTITFEVVKAKK
jgi:polyisoprenoid-binding protein YceI